MKDPIDVSVCPAALYEKREPEGPRSKVGNKETNWRMMGHGAEISSTKGYVGLLQFCVGDRPGRAERSEKQWNPECKPFDRWPNYRQTPIGRKAKDAEKKPEQEKTSLISCRDGQA